MSSSLHRLKEGCNSTLGGSLYASIEYKYSQTLGFALEYKHEYGSFLSSPLAVKRDIAVTILLRCMCVRVCMHACVRMSVRICLGHNSYFMHGFQNYLTQFLFLRRSSVV